MCVNCLRLVGGFRHRCGRIIAAMERQNLPDPDKELSENDQEPREVSESEEAVTGGDIEREGFDKLSMTLHIRVLRDKLRMTEGRGVLASARAAYERDGALRRALHRKACARVPQCGRVGRPRAGPQ